MKSSLLNYCALSYVLIIYGLGVWLLTVSPWALNLVGTVLLTHALVLSALFTHEFMHGAIFKYRSLNALAGQALTHLNGACYACWDELVEHHFNHHVHHLDFVPFDIFTFVNTLPSAVRRLLLAMEWAYFPAFELILRLRIMLVPLIDSQKRSQRLRTVVLLVYRGGLFALSGWFFPKAVVLYAVAYVCFVNLMRFADAFHHRYDYAIVGQPFPKYDRAYEQANTFSNLVSVEHPVLNLLFLNFGYHNAHHHDMRCPWYGLPQLHHKLYGDDARHLLPLPQLVANYHRFRLDRLRGGQGAADAQLETVPIAHPTAQLTGGVGVSFLTPP